MGAATETMDIIRGGSFLVEEHPLEQVFIPEEFTEEEQMTGDLVADFVTARSFRCWTNSRRASRE